MSPTSQSVSLPEQEEEHIDIAGPRHLTDFAIKLGSAIFHLHKIKLYFCCGYFKALLDQQLPEHDPKALKGEVPILELPADFLSDNDRRVQVLRVFFEFAYELKPLNFAEDDFPFDLWSNVESLCYTVHYFDCKSVEERNQREWAATLCNDSGAQSEYLGYTLRISHRFHFSAVYEKAMQRVRNQFVGHQLTAEEKKGWQTIVEEVSKDAGCMKKLLKGVFE